MFKDEPKKTQKALIKAMVDRMTQAYGVDKKGLGVIFGCPVNTINNWVYYTRIPHEQLEQCHHETGASMDWLMFNEQAPTQAQTKLAALQVDELKDLIKSAITGAQGYSLLDFKYPEAVEQLTDKLVSDLDEWQQKQSVVVADK